MKTASEAGAVTIACVGDYVLMQIAPAADGGSCDSSGNMWLLLVWHSITIGVKGKKYWCFGENANRF